LKTFFLQPFDKLVIYSLLENLAFPIESKIANFGIAVWKALLPIICTQKCRDSFGKIGRWLNTVAL
jgi:hypothetical protein